MIDQDLLRKINRGRCFVLVGSGPSCEVGYPSWHNLAKRTYEQLMQDGLVQDTRSYESYLEQKKYPELFRQAEVDIGGREALINLLKPLLIPADKGHGFIYEILSKWPFACYLTTNFDDELASYVRQTGEYFDVLRNRREDFHAIRDGASHLIQKLHSDLEHPDEVVLTSADYRRLYVDDEGQYFRDKLRQIMEMFDIFIIGHSLSDPDIDNILQLARKTASPVHPIFMISSDFNQADEREFLEKYNIVLLRYQNPDGKHAKLRKLLSVANKFIVPRGQWEEGAPSETLPIEEVQAASALFLFRRLQPARSAAIFTPLILAALSTTRDQGIGLNELLAQSSLKVISKTGVDIRDVVLEDIGILKQEGLLEEESGLYQITKIGLERVHEYQAVRDTEKKQAYGQLAGDLRKVYSRITREQIEKCQQLAEMAIVSTFASRSLTIANKVFAGQSAGPKELSDIFGYVTEVAIRLESSELRAAFIEAMYQFVVTPNTPQKKYLASISQGYFLFHLLGLDPKCAKLRREIFDRTIWLCDSSILLPLVAVGCHNHDYAMELFRILVQAKAVLYTTTKLLQEAWEHFNWALNFVKINGVESPEFIRAALIKGSYKQNLFLDGYIRMSAEGRIGTFGDYLESVCPKGRDRSSFEDNINQQGVRVLTPSNIEGFSQEDWGDIEDAKVKIKSEREFKGTYRTELQVESEAEVWVLVKHLRSGKFTLPGDQAAAERFYFVSQSKILDNVFQAESITTWTPEAVYRYLSALPEENTDPELLQQCMLHEYFYAGVSFIDKDRYLRFFGPSIDAAKASYKQEKRKYIAEVERTHIKDLDDAFARTPDLEKPFFVAQMGWRLAEVAQKSAEYARKKVLEGEIKIKQLEAEKAKGWKTLDKKAKEQEAARLRNLQDPKHVRKRLQQAEKRRKKKKK